MTLLGYLLSAPDNDSYMLQGPTAPPRCDLCGFVLDHAWIDPCFRLQTPRFDLSYTYDGYAVATERFCESLGNRGGRCDPLASVPGYYSLTSDEVVRFDAERRKTRFERRCDRCGRFGAVTGATPVFLAQQLRLPDRLLRTDIEFGSGDEQTPLLLVGPGLGDVLATSSLAGLDLTPVQAGT